MKFGEPAPFEMVIWNVAERFGWTLEYIEGLSMQRMNELMQIDNGKMKARGDG